MTVSIKNIIQTFIPAIEAHLTVRRDSGDSFLL